MITYIQYEPTLPILCNATISSCSEAIFIPLFAACLKGRSPILPPFLPAFVRGTYRAASGDMEKATPTTATSSPAPRSESDSASAAAAAGLAVPPVAVLFLRLRNESCNCLT